jgi:hypothetical protein
MVRLRRYQASSHSGAWLLAPPLAKDGGTTFSPAEWQALLRFRAAIPMQARVSCGGCSTPLDIFGDHALACASCGLYARHNRLRDALAAELVTAGIVVRTEVPLPGASTRPADILVADPDDATPTAVDVSMVHPLQLSSSSAEDIPGSFAAERETAKRATSASACAAA